VAVITNPSRDARFKIKEALALRSERSMRPAGMSEYARLRDWKKVLNDAFGVRPTFAPVFVDEEIGGYDAMKTVRALLIDPRTRMASIVILAGDAELENVKTDFERFLKDGVVEVVNRNIDAKDLTEKIGELRAKNLLADKNYARAVSNAIATRSAESLAKITGETLAPEQEADLFAVVRDKVGRPLNCAWRRRGRWDIFVPWRKRQN
jgi:hypothetical protein